MTIAGNFVRSVCVLAPLLLLLLPLSPSAHPRSPRSHSHRHSSPVRSFISPLHSIRGPEFVRGGNLFSVTSRRPQPGPLCFARTHRRNLPRPEQWGPGLRCRRKRPDRRICPSRSLPCSAPLCPPFPASRLSVVFTQRSMICGVCAFRYDLFWRVHLPCLTRSRVISRMNEERWT